MKQFFSYTCTLNTPLKNFAGCMDQGDLLLNLLRHQQDLRMTPQEQEEIKALSVLVVNQMTQEVISKTCLISRQYPVRVLFFANPVEDQQKYPFNAVTLSPEGRCYLFTSSRQLMRSYARKNCKVRAWA